MSVPATITFFLITRNYLANLPISVEEIYELTGEKNKRFRKVYQNIENMYDRPDARNLPFLPEVIITEDSGSGYQFFEKQAARMGISCISAKGKTNLPKKCVYLTQNALLCGMMGEAFFMAALPSQGGRQEVIFRAHRLGRTGVSDS